MTKLAGTLLGTLLCAATIGLTGAAWAEVPIRIGITTPLQVQVGRDTVDGAQMAIAAINAKGGLLGRKLQMVSADETENPEQGISAIKKLTGGEKVDVLVGGYSSGVVLAQLPHISAAKTIYLGVGAASPAITQKVKQDYENYKYIFRVSPPNSINVARSMINYIAGFLKGEMGYTRLAIVGENAKWVQDLMPTLKKGAIDAGMDVRLAEFFDTGSTDFSPLLAKVKASDAQYLFVILSHASSDTFAKQWYDARFPIPYGGLDVKGMDADFFSRVGGKAIGEVVTGSSAARAPLSPVTIPFFDGFRKRYGREPVYSGFGAYDALMVYAAAVNRAKSTAADAVIKELEKTDQTVTAGRLQFDETHDVKAGLGFVNLLYLQWQDKGERVIVWPKELRTGTYVNPPWIK